MIDKCIVSGCNIQSRGVVKIDTLSMAFQVCGTHRRILAEMMNRVANQVQRAHGKAVAQFIIDLDELGDHSAEAELRVAT